MSSKLSAKIYFIGGILFLISSVLYKNYVFIPNTISGDGEEVDVYIIGEFEPLETYEGYVVAIIKRKNDIEDKLVVCKELNKYSKDQIKALVEFQERFFESKIITY